MRKALQKFAAAANKWMHVFQQTADAVKHRDLHFYSPTVGSHSIKPDEDEATRLRTFVTFEGREPDGIWGIYGGGIYFVGMDVHVWLSTLIDRLGLRPERAT